MNQSKLKLESFQTNPEATRPANSKFEFQKDT